MAEEKNEHVEPLANALVAAVFAAEGQKETDVEDNSAHIINSIIKQSRAHLEEDWVEDDDLIQVFLSSMAERAVRAVEQEKENFMTSVLITQSLIAVEAARAKMQADQEEIDRLKEETRSLISKMMAA